jgi:S-adenosylmethionine hydrolase
MSIITLTSDFGWRDNYLSSLKGKLLCQIPNTTIIDISHEVMPQNVIDASFIFKNAYANFPEQTIHIVAVDLAGTSNIKLLYCHHENMHFIIPDNGIISLVFEELPKNIIEIDLLGFPLYISYKEIFAYLCEKISNHEPIEGKLVQSIKSFTMLRPMTYPDMIKGSVIYIDHFDNAITNIKKNEFDAIRKERSYEIQFSKNILQLSETYSNVPEGEKLCLFNSIGLLEIAINKGNASSLLNLKGGSTIQIFFK